MAFGNSKSAILSTLIALFWIVYWSPSAASAEPLNISQRAPGFKLPDLSGNMVALDEYKGRFVLVDFWATWCIPCRKSLPELAAMDKKYRSQGVTVLGLAVDDSESFDNQYIQNFIEKYQVAYTILRADEQVIEQYLGKDQPQVPVLFIIDPKGRIAEKIVGFTGGKIESSLEKLIQH